MRLGDPAPSTEVQNTDASQAHERKLLKRQPEIASIHLRTEVKGLQKTMGEDKHRLYPDILLSEAITHLQVEGLKGRTL